MTKKDLVELDKEIVYFVRRNATDPLNRIGQKTDAFSGNGTTTDFELTKGGRGAMPSVITSATDLVTGTVFSYGTDYSLRVSKDTGTGTIIFTSAPPAGSSNISVAYNFGTDWVYPDLPAKTTTINHYPRIGITDVNSTEVQIDLGTGMTQTSILKDVIVYGRDSIEVRTLVNELKDAFKDGRDAFYNTGLVRVVGIGPMVKEPDRNEKILSQNISIEAPYVWET